MGGGPHFGGVGHGGDRADSVRTEAYATSDAVSAAIEGKPVAAIFWTNPYFQGALLEKCKQREALMIELRRSALKYEGVLEIAAAIGTKEK